MSLRTSEPCAVCEPRGVCVRHSVQEAPKPPRPPAPSPGPTDLYTRRWYEMCAQHTVGRTRRRWPRRASAPKDHPHGCHIWPTPLQAPDPRYPGGHSPTPLPPRPYPLDPSGGVNWQAVGKRYKQGLLTPADYGTHYKCIVHRQFKLRRGAGGDSCKVCGTQKETVYSIQEDAEA